MKMEKVLYTLGVQSGNAKLIFLLYRNGPLKGMFCACMGSIWKVTFTELLTK
jgi:hypothetical protein